MNENVENASVQEEGLDLREILRALVDKIFWIIGAVVLCAALTFVYTKMTFVPMYTSNVTIYANNGKLQSTTDISLPTFYAEDFAKIAVEQGVLEKAIAEYDLDTTWQSLRANLTVFVEEESRLVYMSVSNPDPEVAQKMAAAVSEVAKATLAASIEVELATTITPATLPTSPSGSGMTLKLIVASLVGFVLSAGAVIALHVVRDRINSVEGVERALDLTVLGVIPFQKKKIENGSKLKGEKA